MSSRVITTDSTVHLDPKFRPVYIQKPRLPPYQTQPNLDLKDSRTLPVPQRVVTDETLPNHRGRHTSFLGSPLVARSPQRSRPPGSLFSLTLPTHRPTRYHGGSIGVGLGILDTYRTKYTVFRETSTLLQFLKLYTSNST